MDLFEHQGKQLFKSYGLPVSDGEVVFDAEAAAEAAEKMGYPVVVKAQVHTGGRGKAGGVKLTHSKEETLETAGKILGLDINGHIVKRLWIEKASDIEHEYYLSFTLDRSARKHLGMLSAEGGIEIETVAQDAPEKISNIWVDPIEGLSAEVCRDWIAKANLDEAVSDELHSVLMRLYEMYEQSDADLIEVNPLIITPDKRVVLLDSKITLDSNADFRHEDYSTYDETQPRDEWEQAAHEKGLQYVGLGGSVGIIANGAGLAMSTVDIVTQVGGTPANFLDVGGGANATIMANALGVINSDPRVKSIFINIFGGITRGEEVANGILGALEQIEISSPLVVRLDGTNAEEGREILKPHLSDKLILEETMLSAAEKVVGLAKY